MSPINKCVAAFCCFVGFILLAFVAFGAFSAFRAEKKLATFQKAIQVLRVFVHDKGRWPSGWEEFRDYAISAREADSRLLDDIDEQLTICFEKEINCVHLQAYAIRFESTSEFALVKQKGSHFPPDAHTIRNFISGLQTDLRCGDSEK